jgi:NAD dependent epimerase/dehydratase
MHNLAGKRVLVTGAGGFIASHLCERLVAEGAAVRALVHYRFDHSIGNLRHASPAQRDAIEIVHGSVEDPFQVDRCVAGCDTVFHLAALIAIPYSYQAPASYIATNVHGTLNVLEACRRHGVRRLIHTSTSEVYGTALYTPIDERHPLQAQSPYSASKIAADKLVESYHLSFGLPAVTIRPFNTYGPRQSSRAVIPTIVHQALHADEIRLGALDPVRDLTHVSDTAAGFLAGAQTPGIEGMTINLGTGSAVSVGELAAEIQRVIGVDKSIVADPARLRPKASEVMRLLSDNRLARERMGWGPRLTLAEGLASTVAFFRNNSPETSAAHYVV